MRKLLFLLFFLLIATKANSESFPDGSEISTPDMAKCAAAALKIDKELWGQWYAALKSRYTIIYKDQTPQKIQDYTLERVLDKRRALNRLGFDSKRAFKGYFEMNCSGEI